MTVYEFILLSGFMISFSIIGTIEFMLYIFKKYKMKKTTKKLNKDITFKKIQKCDYILNIYYNKQKSGIKLIRTLDLPFNKKLLSKYTVYKDFIKWYFNENNPNYFIFKTFNNINDMDVLIKKENIFNFSLKLESKIVPERN